MQPTTHGAISPAGESAGGEDPVQVVFAGRRGALCWLALNTGLFTVLTLGVYRFWMKTRLRRWYWSAIRPGGHGLEYTGDPLEKLLGFLIAVVVLTFYIGIVNLLLMFVSFSVFAASWVGYVASALGIVPLLFYARYRARRYILGRTRWRGVRFGVAGGAWGYAARGLAHWCVTILSLGLLWPRMTFALEKYRTDRTYFGSARLVQGGSWPMLYRAAIPFGFSFLALAVSVAWIFWVQPVTPDWAALERDAQQMFDDMLDGRATTIPVDAPWRLMLLPLFTAGLLYGAIHYRWVSKRIMANHKHAYGLALRSRLSGARVAFIYVFGNFIAYLVLIVGLVSLGALAVWLLGLDLAAEILGVAEPMDVTMPGWLGLLSLVALYLGVFTLWGAAYNAFVTFPLIRHMARTTSLPRAQGLAAISQRARDDFAEAEGFAEALDVGAAI